MERAGLEIVNLRKSYGHVSAVDDVSLSVPEGEFLSLLGPSGSGKTSVLMMLAGFVDPSGGDVRVLGRSMIGVPPEARQIGVVFQNYALFPHMRVENNLSFPLEMRKDPAAEIKRRVDDAISLVGLQGLGNRFPNQLSGGQQQRVALARALIFEPRLLLMDEPLGALDKQLRSQMQLELRMLHRRLGTTIVLVTHDQQEALALSDRIAIMRDGKLVQINDPLTLYNDPIDRFTANFVGDCNFITPTSAERRNGEVKISIEHYSGIVPFQSHSITDLTPLKLAVRPHSANLEPPTHREGMPGRVVEAVFLGDCVDYLIEYGNTKHFSVSASTSRPNIIWDRGTEVKVTWDWSASRLL